MTRPVRTPRHICPSVSALARELEAAPQSLAPYLVVRGGGYELKPLTAAELAAWRDRVYRREEDRRDATQPL